MASAGGCEFPEHLHYDVANHLWYVAQPDGLIRLGMTPVAMALADNKLFGS